jgi:hypothetical protein
MSNLWGKHDKLQQTRQISMRLWLPAGDSMTQVRSVSLSEQDVKYLKEHNLSLSAFVRSSLERHRTGDKQFNIEDLIGKLTKYTTRYDEALKFMEEHGLIESFWKEKSSDHTEFRRIREISQTDNNTAGRDPADANQITQK